MEEALKPVDVGALTVDELANLVFLVMEGPEWTTPEANGLNVEQQHKVYDLAKDVSEKMDNRCEYAIDNIPILKAYRSKAQACLLAMKAVFPDQYKERFGDCCDLEAEGRFIADLIRHDAKITFLRQMLEQLREKSASNAVNRMVAANN